MNTAWLNGKCPVLSGASAPPKVSDKEQPSKKGDETDWPGWILFWFISLSLCCVVSWNLLDLVLFVALIKWFNTGRDKDRQNQVDKLCREMKRDSSPLFDYDHDMLLNPLYCNVPGNVAYMDDHTWDDDWTRGHWPHDSWQQND